MNSRLGIFLGVLFFFFLLENIFPRRMRPSFNFKRILDNLALSFFSQALIRIIFIYFTLMELALYISNKEIGLLYQFEIHSGVEILLILLILDFSIYWQHRLFHKIPFFWRFHRVHHTDKHLDASSALRFHPIEIIFSLIFKAILIVLFGISPIGILTFEILLNAMAIFNHSNLLLPKSLDSFLRAFLITPDMHRIHHSINSHQTNSNFGFNLSIWDFLFKSYQTIQYEEQSNLKLGVTGFDEGSSRGVKTLLFQPFKK